MDYELDRIIYYLNRNFHNHLGSFSGMILKDTSPAIILIEDHVRRHLGMPYINIRNSSLKSKIPFSGASSMSGGIKNPRIPQRYLLQKPSYFSLSLSHHIFIRSRLAYEKNSNRLIDRRYH